MCQRSYDALRGNTVPPRRTRLTAERRRETILDAATEVFAAAGYRAAKVSDVAARIGVSEPVIFQNFGSKALYTAALLADPGLPEPARRTACSLAGHLADLVWRGQADGSIRVDADPEAAAWMLLSVLSAGPWRPAVMPGQGRLEGDVADLALQALVPSGEHR